MIIVSHPADLVFLDCVGAGCADPANADSGICRRSGGTSTNPTFDVDDIAADDAGQRICGAGTLRRDGAGIHLVYGARCRVADEVVFNQQTREHGRGGALNSYAARGCGNAVVLNRQIVRRRSRANGRRNRSNRRGSSSGRCGCPTPSEEAVSGVF